MHAERPEPVIKILSGRLAGASTPLRPGTPVYVGRGLRNDIVVRDPGMAKTRLRLQLDGRDGVADIDILEGEADLLGRRCDASSEIALPPFTPLRTGDVALAHGDEADAAGWARCAALMEHSPSAATASSAAEDRWAGARGWVEALARERWVRRWGGSLAAAALIGLGVVQIGLAYGFGPASTPARHLQTILADADYSGLELRHGSRSNEFIVSGFLDSETQRTRLVDEVAALDADIVMEVSTGDSMVRAVEDIFRLNDVPAEVSYAGHRRIRVTNAVATPEQIESLRTIAESDVPGLRRIEIDYTEPAEPEEGVPDDPSKRVATVVGGERGYVVTEDGARYFVGAMLPTGHRIVEIADGEVMVERDGVRTAYQF